MSNEGVWGCLTEWVSVCTCACVSVRERERGSGSIPPLYPNTSTCRSKLIGHPDCYCTDIRTGESAGGRNTSHLLQFHYSFLVLLALGKQRELERAGERVHRQNTQHIDRENKCLHSRQHISNDILHTGVGNVKVEGLLNSTSLSVLIPYPVDEVKWSV